MLGKLRIRLSTLQPWTEVEARLPMLADRDKGGSKVAYAHLTLKVRQVFCNGTQCASKILLPVSCSGFAAMPQLSHACKVVVALCVGDAYHLVFECPVFQPLRDKYHTLCSSRTSSMRSFFAQRDRMIVYKFILDRFRHDKCLVLML